jgi:hypothetical protein
MPMAVLPKFVAIAPGGVDTTQIVMLVLGVVGLTILILSTHRRIRQSQRQPRTSIREAVAESEARQKATRDLEEVMLELDQLSRDIHGRIDTKLARLEALIHEADQRITKLSPPASTVKSKPALEITLDQEDPFEPQPILPPAREDSHSAIYGLADRGLSPGQIAQDLNRLSGEVELILALRRTKEQAGQAG